MSRGSMISSIQKVSAVRNGERRRFRRSSISEIFASRSGAASMSARYAASMPPYNGGNTVRNPVGNSNKFNILSTKAETCVPVVSRQL